MSVVLKIWKLVDLLGLSCGRTRKNFLRSERELFRVDSNCFTLTVSREMECERLHWGISPISTRYLSCLSLSHFLLPPCLAEFYFYFLPWALRCSKFSMTFLFRAWQLLIVFLGLFACSALVSHKLSMASGEPRSNLLRLLPFTSFDPPEPIPFLELPSAPFHPCASFCLFQPHLAVIPVEIVLASPFWKGWNCFLLGLQPFCSCVPRKWQVRLVKSASVIPTRTPACLHCIAWCKWLRKRRRQTNPVPWIGGLICSSDFVRWVFQNVDVPPNCLLFEGLCACVVSCSYESGVQAQNRTIRTPDSGCLRDHLAVFVVHR